MPEDSAVSYGKRLTEIAAVRPDEVDLTFVSRDGSETGISWGDLERRANQIARAFERHGVVQDSIVGVALPSCPDHVLATLAIWKLGATMLPLRHDIPQLEMGRLLDMAEPTLLVSDHHDAGCTVMSRSDLAATTSLPDHALPDRISECVNLVASSGSTGKPKLIVTPSRGVVAEQAQTTMVMEDDSNILVLSPLYHVNGFAFASPALLEGSKVVVLEKFDAALAVDVIERHRITYTVMVPTMLQRIARLPDVTPERLASLQRLVYGGAKIAEWVVDRWLELIPPRNFMFTYGSSERLGLMAMTGEDWATHRGATGLPTDVDLSIRDETGEPVPVGTVGEIHMRPLEERRMFEYVGAETPTASADGFYTIGDLGWVDEDGYLYIADRRTDMIITGGANVFPAEVEEALSAHPAVADQVVVGVPDPEWGHRVHAIVQPMDPDDPPPIDELRAHCKERLAAYKVPKTYELVDRVPRTEAGKLNRNDLGAARGG